MAYTVIVNVKSRVDACGEYLHAQTITVNGKIGDCQVVAVAPGPPADPVSAPPVCPPQPGGQRFNPDEPSTFNAVYKIGTQFGGITLEEQVVTDTQAKAGSVHRENTATINKAPVMAKGR
jgi:hypothetical protein